MAIRFFRRIKIAPGVSLNFSKSGGSLSLGPRGAKVTAGRRGIRRTVGLPGTGLFYTDHKNYGTNPPARQASASAPQVTSALNLGFFKKLFTPPEEKAFIAGLKAIHNDDEKEAYTKLLQASTIPDAWFTAAMLAMRMEKADLAEPLLKQALEAPRDLGKHYKKYGLSCSFSFAITERMRVEVVPSPRGALLALAEVHQKLGRWEDSVDELRALVRAEASDPFARLALCEMLISEQGDEAACKEVVRLSKGIENTEEVAAAILLWKGIALQRLRIPNAALETFTLALRRKKDRSEALLQALRYERALTYACLGKRSRARAELEKLYAEAPGYEDVAERLGLGD